MEILEAPLFLLENPRFSFRSRFVLDAQYTKAIVNLNVSTKPYFVIERFTFLFSKNYDHISQSSMLIFLDGFGNKILSDRIESAC